MYQFRVKNYREALYFSLQTLNNEGVEITARGMNTKELENVLFEIENPKDKIALIEGRKANIFATIAETLWVLGGRNDLEFISHYVPKMDDFSDPSKVLYGGYGPRIQKWYGVNQLEQIYNLLVKDKNTRRAVISLFDPSRDFFSDDFPCSNWLHFTIRNNQLNLKVVSRSMDIIWGSTLNFFEWSVLQEIVANWLNIEVGKFYYYISSLHIYEPFYERMNNILSNTLNSSNLKFTEWNIPYQFFKEELEIFFIQEERIRLLKEPELEKVNSNVIKLSLIILFSYNQHKNQNYEQTFNLISQCPDCDLKTMAIDFYRRNHNYTKILEVYESNI